MDVPRLYDAARAHFQPMIGAKNWAAWVAQLTDHEIESMNARYPDPAEEPT